MVEINSNVNSMDQAVIKMFTVNVKHRKTLEL